MTKKNAKTLVLLVHSVGEIALMNRIFHAFYRINRTFQRSFFENPM